MSSIRKRGKAWEASIRRTGQENISGSFPTREEAVAFAEECERRIAHERRLAADPKATLPDSGRLEDETLLATLSHFKKSDACINRHDKILPTLVAHVGSAKIGELKPSWMSAYTARMRKQTTRRKTNYAYETILAHFHMINVALKWRAEQVDAQPPRFIIDTKKLFPKGWQNQRERRFEKGEEQALMQRLSTLAGPSGAHLALLVGLAIETCARLQELVLAEWKEFESDNEFWTIPLAHTKCRKQRVMPLTDRAIRLVEQLRALAKPECERVFHPFTNPDSVSGLFHRWSIQAGLVDFRFHDLRHEGISRFVLTQRNFTVNEIMLMVGHSNPAMLQRYSNLRGNELAAKMIRVSTPPPQNREPASFAGASVGLDLAAQPQAWMAPRAVVPVATSPSIPSSFAAQRPLGAAPG